MPLVSVCVPTYNYGRFLPDCIESVLEQTLDDWELVICDDESTDGTEALVRSYADRDARIRYVRNERRLGMNGNLKRAADSARGRYVKMLCADDWIAPRCLEVLSTLMEEHPRAVLATSAEVYTDEFGTPLKVQFLFGEPVSLIDGERMLDGMAGGEGFRGNSSFFIRASAYHEVGGYDQALLYAADYDLAARLCRIGDYLHTDEPLFYGRSQPESSSSVNTRLLLDVRDWFAIPDKIFRPRPAGSREWRRYQRLTASLTARYLLNIVLETARGHHDYARELRGIVMREGNLVLGLPLLALQGPRRALARMARRNVPASSPPEPWMGTPVARRGAPAAQAS
ncbi:MAG TPA: glycosyltransferase family 2 protein [Longimicrobiaceae bacterium]|nr:glycosyltransferase family 2 protein [Longimicrobiaceae bacterium]